MNIWVRRSLEATLLAAGFVVVGGGIANAAEPAHETPQPAQLGRILPGLPDPTGVLGTLTTPVQPVQPVQPAPGRPAQAQEQQPPARQEAAPSSRETARHAEPARPIDAGVTVPIDAADNVVGTPVGQYDLPGHSGELSTRVVTDAVQDAAAPALTAGAPVLAAARPATGAANEVAATVTAAGRQDDELPYTPFTRPDRTTSGPAGDDPFLGNRLNADLVVPVQITGNAFAAGGPATVEGADHSQSYDASQDVTTGGAGVPLAGNVVDADWAVPVQLANNAVGWGGSATTVDGNADQEVTTGGDDVTDGREGFGSGNVVTGQWATPVQVTGNAVSWGGTADVVDSTASTTAQSGGGVDTAGSESFGSGNVGAVPLGLPVELNGNAPAWGGRSDAVSNTTADVTAGDTLPGNRGRATYVQTDGDSALLGGNVVQPQGSLVANAASIAAALGGFATTGGATAPDGGDPIADALSLATRLGGGALGGSSMHTVWPLPTQRKATSSSTTNNVTSGGYTTTSGRNGAGSGNVADAPAAVPAEVFAVGGNLGFQSHAAMDNATTTTAGGKTFTNGNGSALSGNTASSPLAGTAEAFGAGAAVAGNGSGTATETKNVKSGGYNGTLGDDSLGSGNVASIPASVPGEVFGVGGAVAGQGAGTASETKLVKAGDDGNTVDDNGTVSSNLAAVPVALPAQVFGIGGAAIGHGSGIADADTTAIAGHDYNTSGMLGTVAGNIAQAPVALPAQVHGLGAAGIGTGEGSSTNLSDATAGGTNTASGSGGAVAGNVVNAPFAGTAGVFSLAANAVGESAGTAANDVTSVAGGDTTTAGEDGQISGNVVSASGVPVAQAFDSAASALSGAVAGGDSTTSATSGGDITTAGADGALAGQIVDVPASGIAQGLGDTASVLGVAQAGTTNTVTGSSGGDAVSDVGALQVPVDATAQVLDLEAGVLGEAMSLVHGNDVDVTAGPSTQLIDLPLDLS